MTALLRPLALAVVLSGLIHICSILAIPFFAEGKVWQRVVRHTEGRKMAPLRDHAQAVAILGQADPAMAYAICHFSMSDGPVSVSAEGATGFWNATLFNDRGEVIYSLHDDVSQTNELNLEVIPAGGNAEDPSSDAKSSALPAEPGTSIPIPLSRPRLPEEGGEASETDNATEDENQPVRVWISENQAFLVMKIFRSSRHYARLIAETFEAAECK